MRGNKVIIVNITFIMFYFTGGMPEAVNCLIETGDLDEIK